MASHIQTFLQGTANLDSVLEQRLQKCIIHSLDGSFNRLVKVSYFLRICK